MLVIAQVALSLVLLVGAGLLMKSFLRLQHVDVGFDPRGVQVAAIRLPESRYADSERYSAFFEALLERAKGIPGTRNAALVSSAPFAGPNTGMSFLVPERPPLPGDPPPDADFRVVSPDYFRTLKIAMVRGRDFGPVDRRGTPDVVIISEAAARRYWPGIDPLGHRLQVGSGDKVGYLTIVGVAKDARYSVSRIPTCGPWSISRPCLDRFDRCPSSSLARAAARSLHACARSFVTWMHSSPLEP